MFIEPGNGSRIWRTDIASVSPGAVVALLSGMLATPPFLSQAELDRRMECEHTAKIALDRIVEAICEQPEKQGTRELRHFLWSLFNAHHDLNLWRLRQELDLLTGALVTDVFSAWMQGLVPDDLLRRALEESGEIERREASKPGGCK